MTTINPITPPLELVHQWTSFACEEEDGESWNSIATQAAQWGADMELEACCEWLVRNYNYPRAGHPLRAARRSKLPSLKEQARDALDTYIYGEPDPKDKERTYNTIRAALEALDD
jgi:hypothetical protein